MSNQYNGYQNNSNQYNGYQNNSNQYNGYQNNSNQYNGYQNNSNQYQQEYPPLKGGNEEVFTPPNGNMPPGNPVKPQTYAYAAPLQGGNSTTNYPQAEPHYPDPNMGPTDGIPLYPTTTQNPNLQRFVKKGWKDVWAAVLFLCFFIMTFVWGIVNMVSYKTNTVIFTDKDFMGIHQPYVLLAIIIICSFAVSIVTSFVCVMLMTCFPKAMIYIGNILSILVLAALTVLSFINVSVFMGIVLTVLTLLNIVWFIVARKRIPFAAAVLRSATRVLNKYKAIFAFKILILVVLIAFSIFWSFALIRSIDHANNDTFTGFDTFVVILFVFTFYWVMQVLPNMMLVTTAGVTATWYFVGFDNMPQNPTVKSFLRSVTTSFGSICFGSLIVAIIQFLRWLAESAGHNGDCGFLGCCLLCILSCLEGLIEYFNTYAYVHIAMYGYGYISAAKHTFELFKQCLFTALFNDCLINPTLNMLSLTFSLMIGTLFGLSFWAISVGLLAFLVSIVVHNLFLTAVSSASVTIFVCFAEVPEALRVTDPELYDVFQRTDQGGTNNNAAPQP